jgi:hypothetical protein
VIKSLSPSPGRLLFCLLIPFFASRATAAPASSPIDYYSAGNEAYQAENYSEAVTDYQMAVQANPQSWEAYQGLGNAYYQMDKNDEALVAYKQSLALHPDNPTLSQFVSQMPDSSTKAGAKSKSAAPKAATGNTGESSLPKPGKIVWNVGGAGSLYTFDDISTFDGTPETGFNYGGEADLGVDYTLAPNFQAGVQVQFLGRLPEGNGSITWNNYVIGETLDLKGLIPVMPGMNLILHGQGGLYTLIGSSMQTVDSQGNFSTPTLSASGPGGMAEVQAEILMDADKSWALDFGLGYRYLILSPVTSSVGVNSSQSLLNPDQSNAQIDFSGPRISGAFRFFN